MNFRLAKFSADLTRLHRGIDFLCLAVVLGLFIYVLSEFSALPDQVPVHFNLKGEVDRWGMKGTLFFLPFSALAATLVLTVARCNPRYINLPQRVEVTEENRSRVMPPVNILVSSLQVLITAIFVVTVYSTVSIAKQESAPILMFSVYVFLALVFVVSLVGSVKIRKAQKPKA